MITNAGREMIIDVLQHAATGGSFQVPERHFDANTGARITLQRNSPYSPAETLQRLFEGLGFPRDLVTQFLTDLAQSAQFPSFSNVSDLLEENGAFQPFLVQSCFELFNCMTWFQREETETEIGVEEGDQILSDEVETLQGLFSDSYVGQRNFEETTTADRELYFNFPTAEEGRFVLVAVRVPDYYPNEPPTVYLQPLASPLNGSLPELQLLPSCTKDLPAAARRAVLDAAVSAINGLVGGGCLMGLVSAVGGTISDLRSAATSSPSPTQPSSDNASQKRQEAAVQRKAFVAALTGKQEPTDDADEQERFIQISMPEKVEMRTVEPDATVLDTRRRDFLRKNADLDSSLASAWQTLRKEGALKKSRESLPAFAVREQLRIALASHNVVVIGGETGSGKTTQIPQYLYEFMCEDGNGSAANIVCTQPRRLAATSVALRVAEERDEAVGGTVGYSIRLENCVSSKTQITYCTTGIVLRRLQTDKFLGKVSHVVVDEIHERGVDTDFLLILLRDLVSRRSDLKVVLMSATMDSDLFARYFGGAPVLSIKGRTFPVKVMHLEQIIPEVHYNLEDGSPFAKPSGSQEARRRNARKNILNLGLEEAAEDQEEQITQRSLSKTVSASPQTLNTLSRMNFDVINYELIECIVDYIDNTLRVEGAVLVFLPGMAEIQRCMEQLKFNPKLARTCLFYNLHSSLGSAEQQGVFARPPRGKRKVILGTNIMETSITIDDAVFVIDTGKAKENRYNARKSLSELVTVNIAKANCRQRQGRAGRVREGYCFRLFTEAQFESLEDHQLCEMHRVPLESLILQIYSLHLGDEVEYLQKALTPPEERAINSSVKVLTTLGALTTEKRLTSLGQHLANLPLDVRVGKMIIHGTLLRCVDPVLTMAASLAVRAPFIASIDFRAEVEGVQRAFAGEHASDQLASWFAYARWISALKQKGAAAAQKVCNECYLSPATLLQIQSTKRQYEQYLYEAGFLEGHTGGRPSTYKFIYPLYSTLDDRVYEAGGEAYNVNSNSARCILACLVAGLYPNVARLRKLVIGRPPRLTTFDGSDCLIHPSSVASRQTSFSSQLFVYVNKVKTSATFLREVSMITPLHVVLFCGGALDYLAKYQELCVDDVIAFRCGEEEAALLTHLKAQLDSALTQKINDPKQTWESVSSVVVRAIVKLLKGEGVAAGGLTIIDRRQGHAPQLTENLASDGAAASATNVTVPEDQPFRTNKSCFLCGETGHVSRYCPHNATHSKGGPPVRCFICGQWHFPQDCALVKPLRR